MGLDELDELEHPDFEVVRTDDRYGGFEEVKLKDGRMSVGLPISPLHPFPMTA